MAVVDIAYSKRAKRIDLLVPKGTKLAEVAKIQDQLFNARDILARLPRGCDACYSGDHLRVRERLTDRVRIDLRAAKGVRVDLDKMEVVETLGRGR